MTMRVIFVPVADRPECGRALGTAFDLGHRLGANILGCHIRPHSNSEVSFPAGAQALGGVEPISSLVWSEKKIRKQSKSAHALFGKVAAKQGYDLIRKPRSKPGAVWLEKVGAPDKVLSIQGPVADLTLVSRPEAKPGGKPAGKRAEAFLLAALMNSAKPVLVLPRHSEPKVGRHVSIAWNQSPEAARAVAAAMPLLQQAKRVTIISNGSESALGPKSKQLATYLEHWGLDAKLVRTHGRQDGKALVKACSELDSDLLVMGAYSRSRLRQRVFGGVTEHMLYKADLPVFLLHT